MTGELNRFFEVSVCLAEEVTGVTQPPDLSWEGSPIKRVAGFSQM